MSVETVEVFDTATWKREDMLQMDNQRDTHTLQMDSVRTC